MSEEARHECESALTTHTSPFRFEHQTDPQDPQRHTELKHAAQIVEAGMRASFGASLDAAYAAVHWAGLVLARNGRPREALRALFDRMELSYREVVAAAEFERSRMLADAERHTVVVEGQGHVVQRPWNAWAEEKPR